MRKQTVGYHILNLDTNLWSLTFGRRGLPREVWFKAFSPLSGLLSRVKRSTRYSGEFVE